LRGSVLGRKVLAAGVALVLVWELPRVVLEKVCWAVAEEVVGAPTSAPVGGIEMGMVTVLLCVRGSVWRVRLRS